MAETYKPNLQYTDFKDLTDQIQFHSNEGKIWFGEQRVLLMSLASLAAFRREIVNSMGVERAKGFFLRLGYTSGVKDAELARKLRPDSDDIDTFLAGPQLHALKGMVKVIPHELDLDRETGVLHGILEWENSWEVEICKTELGQMDEPACWVLLGYACAYSSSFMGREIIFQEISCRGCGDEKCIIEGRPAEEWENAEAFSRYFKDDPLIEELYDLQEQLTSLRSSLHKQQGQYYGIGQSPSYNRVCRMIDKAAQGKVSVLLLGETGVGKEVIARSVHQRSERSEDPFVAVNCAAIPPDLTEAELFGVEKGAYTGANQSREGRFERANGGTIFLDEVVELTPRAQATLLRVLQEGELERVGDNKTRKVNVRVIAATNESLEQAVEEGRFRADLFYRLNVFPVKIPPLRERLEDLPLLVEHFLEKFHAQYNKRTLGLSDKALELCLAYHWPGNIRELENVIERGVILTDNNETISQEALFVTPPEVNPAGIVRVDEEGNITTGDSGTEQTDWPEQIFAQQISLDQVEGILMQKAMEEANQNVSKAARLLGLTRPALAYRLKKAGILDG
ncbi:MAG TPA: sigma-54-dependent Fis family transcriptional regulator [Marinobacter hydrocarbonoclasticus]|uniref:sigma-54-dependent Fis family transcriptional regulator n=1 Tax=Alphaproteobacteria TaxID=28211 RepID=UPI000C6256DC|nr:MULTISPECIES: sigma-54-dependent Fis family transcriptional regulator [Alphaproteobacteria]MAO59002.1 sigma-54-dependent Fis family transcriptional regulator [Alcanivorax sp.]HAX10287.1 sigma-54-dependent Fis family transcriptional regulator [Marinobacter nauticus]MAU23688.1 sigma-54-dependent Fis family transcriptional regulator [Martelella sp.]MBC37431.1 sigma-54-dependent Fis family transcriptional regulator [Oceanicaulis sp.]MBI53401.1 sigma-54-dependent Fis family transcriptional regul|tara:strand:- start:96 stop:1796 length:1701 start_codon:yes stop_codon:yes gene_type:complete